MFNDTANQFKKICKRNQNKFWNMKLKNLKDEFNDSETKFWNAWNFFDENIKSNEPFMKKMVKLE